MATTASSTQLRVISQSKSQNNNYNNNNNNNHTRARARTREGILDAVQESADQKRCYQIQHGNFAQAYEDAIGRPATNVILREIDSMMERGISSCLIHAVIEYTAGAPRPSWAYARYVILANYARGINDEEAFVDAIGTHHG